jgi:uncharacterized protein (DUF433 family)
MNDTPRARLRTRTALSGMREYMTRNTATESSELEDADLIARWIEPDPNRPGAYNVWIVEYCIHVWALIGHLEAVDNCVDRVAEDYDIPVEAVRAAVDYYRAHKEIIDARLAANAA